MPSRSSKAAEGKELQVHGSSGLLQTLLKAQLIDELRIMTFPVVLGKGKRLFGSGATPSAMELVEHKRTATGVSIQVYRPVGAVKNRNHRGNKVASRGRVMSYAF